MSQSRPTPEFAKVKLETATVSAGERFYRLYLDIYPDALGFGKSPSRFSDSRRRIAANRFGVLYLGQSLKVCFLEALLRDERNGKLGDYPLAESELQRWLYAEINIARALKLVDLRGDAAIRMGVPSDVARASHQSLARAWSVAFYEHPETPDGIIYPSRLNLETNLAIYDRAVPKLKLYDHVRLIDAPGLASVLDDLAVAIV
jgi:RES domain